MPDLLSLKTEVFGLIVVLFSLLILIASFFRRILFPVQNYEFADLPEPIELRFIPLKH